MVSQLANVAARERAVIDEFESLLSSAAALQVNPKCRFRSQFNSGCINANPMSFMILRI